MPLPLPWTKAMFATSCSVIGMSLLRFSNTSRRITFSRFLSGKMLCAETALPATNQTATNKDSFFMVGPQGINADDRRHTQNNRPDGPQPAVVRNVVDLKRSAR